MSEENVKRLRAVYTEWAKGNFRAGGEHFAPDAVLEQIAEPGSVYRGRDAIAGYIREFLAQWSEFRIEAEEVVDAGVVVIVAERQYAPGKASGVETETTWTELDLDAAELLVSTARVTVGYDVVETAPKSERGYRRVALDPATVAALRAHRSAQATERLAWGPAYSDEGLVFCREDGRGLHPDEISKHFSAAVGSLDVRRITLHGLRHSWASLALAAGVNPKVVSERLGHASVSFTLDVYSHVMPGLQEDAAAKVAALISG